MFYLYIKNKNKFDTKDNSVYDGIHTYWIVVLEQGKVNLSEKNLNNLKFYNKIIGNTLEEVAEKAFEEKPDLVKSGMLFNEYKSFLKVVRLSHSRWVASDGATIDDSYGATCTKCGNHNEYAVVSSTFVCSSCKSYEAMIG